MAQTITLSGFRLKNGKLTDSSLAISGQNNTVLRIDETGAQNAIFRYSSSNGAIDTIKLNSETILSGASGSERNEYDISLKTLKWENKSAEAFIVMDDNNGLHLFALSGDTLPAAEADRSALIYNNLFGLLNYREGAHVDDSTTYTFKALEMQSKQETVYSPLFNHPAGVLRQYGIP